MPSIWNIEQDCDALTIYWSNDSNAASIELDRGPAGATLPLIGRDFKQPFPWSFYDDNNGIGLNPNTTYAYTITNWDNAGNRHFNSASGMPFSCAMPWSGNLIRSTVDTFESKAGSYELLFSQGTFIDHLSHQPGTLHQRHWQFVNRLDVPDGGTIPENAVSLIESNSGNFVAVALVMPPGSSEGYVLSYVFDPSSGWQPPTPLYTEQGRISGTGAAPALIQTNKGHFVLLVPRGPFIDHYIHDGSSIHDGFWKRIDVLVSPQGGTAIQTAVAFTQIASGGLEVIAHVIPLSTSAKESEASSEVGSDDYLLTYTYETYDPLSLQPVHTAPLTVSGKTIGGITGSASLIQNVRGVFELLVPRGPFIDHYTHPKESIQDGLWTFAATLKPSLSEVEPRVIAVSVVESLTRSLEVVARLAPRAGDRGKHDLISYELPRWQGPFGILVHDDPDIREDDEDRREDDQADKS
jgi:hypothetical protein